MKIELLKQPIGIPAKFEGNLCETKISKAHQPLVALEEFLPSIIEDFLRAKKFSNSFSLEFVEQIDSSHGICLVVNFVVNKAELIFDFSDISLKAEFSAFLEQAEEMKSMRTADIKEDPSAETSSNFGSQAKNGSLDQLSNHTSFFCVTDDFSQRTPTEIIDGECFTFNRFSKAVGVMISSRRTLDIAVENSLWLLELADAAKFKNAVRLNICAISDEKNNDKARTLLSYSKFELIEKPIIKIL